MKSKTKTLSVLLPAATLLLLVGVWKLVIYFGKVPSYILPAPEDILRCYTSSGQEMMHNFRVTLVESLLGFLCGSLIGFLTGVAMEQSSFFQKMTLPFLIASNAIPVIAIAPIIVIWFGNTLTAKVVVAAFISFFPVVLNTYRGLMEYKTCFRELFSIYGGTEKQFLFKYKLGNAVPYIFTGLKLNATLCVIGAIVAEFVSSNEGLGFGILQASYNFNSARLWAYIILACLIGIGFYCLVSLVEKRILKKYKTK